MWNPKLDRRIERGAIHTSLSARNDGYHGKAGDWGWSNLMLE